MQKIMLLIAALTIAGCTAQTNDWLIVPGKRVGPINASTTRADLVRIFAAANITEGETTIADNGPLKCTRVFEKHPETSLAILWGENKRFKQLETIILCEQATDNVCRWKMADGTGFGTTLKTLEKMNGRPFKLSGFGWDYGGALTSWEGGRLQAWQTPCGNVALSLDPTEAGTQSPDYSKVLGEGEFLSSTPAMQRLDPRISGIRFSFGDQKGCR
jgi:hypothetical protein